MQEGTGRSVLALVVTSALLASLTSRAGIACTCDKPTGFTTAQEVDRHDIVFAGVLERATPLSLPYLLIEEQPMVETTIAHFRVTQAWKGLSVSTVDVFSAAPGGSCGYPLKEGVAYVVFAKQEQIFSDAPHLGVSRCSPTAPLEEAASLVEELNRLVEKRDR